jgi:hypothetical protein
MYSPSPISPTTERPTRSPTVIPASSPTPTVILTESPTPQSPAAQSPTPAPTPTAQNPSTPTGPTAPTGPTTPTGPTAPTGPTTPTGPTAPATAPPTEGNPISVRNVQTDDNAALSPGAIAGIAVGGAAFFLIFAFIARRQLAKQPA